MFHASLQLCSSVVRQSVWDSYAPVAHLEQLAFTAQPKPALPVVRIPFAGASDASRVACAALPPLPAPFRPTPRKHSLPCAHFSIVLSCCGSAEDFAASCSATLAAAAQALEEGGAKWHDVSGVIVQLADISNFAVLNQCYAACVPRSSPPTRFTFCASLEQPVLFIISIQVSKNSCRHVHVESVSFWAPANIGPYSQSQLYARRGQLDCGSLLLLSGQIALVPERMVLAAADGMQSQLQAECTQIVLNLSAILAANGLSEYAPCCCMLIAPLVVVDFALFNVTISCEQPVVVRRCCRCACYRRPPRCRRCRRVLQRARRPGLSWHAVRCVWRGRFRLAALRFCGSVSARYEPCCFLHDGAGWRRPSASGSRFQRKRTCRCIRPRWRSCGFALEVGCSVARRCWQSQRCRMHGLGHWSFAAANGAHP